MPNGYVLQERADYVVIATGFESPSVNVHTGPLAVWSAWKRGSYPTLENYKVFAGRAVRFGAYGDPFLIDAWVMRAITRVCAKWTGYTHMWRDASPQYRAWLMASCDSIADRDAAKFAGWRTFRAGYDTVAGEIVCPASEEMGKRTTCHKCGLCNGSKPTDPRKDIVIAPHGRGAKYFTVLA